MISFQMNMREVGMEFSLSAKIEKPNISHFQFGMQAGVGSPRTCGKSATDVFVPSLCPIRLSK
jgi:hypothetical protein